MQMSVMQKRAFHLLISDLDRIAIEPATPNRDNTP